jgi:hypothetical protein
MIVRCTVLLATLAPWSAGACQASERAEAASSTGPDAGGPELLGFSGPRGLRDAGLDDLRSAACAREIVAPEQRPAVLQLVVDVSGSMNLRAPGSEQSRWEVVRTALWDAISVLPGGAAVGMLFFPNQSTIASEPTGTYADPPRAITDCVNVDALIEASALGAADSAHRRRLKASLDALTPSGGTPTHDAFEVARAALEAVDLGGDRFLLLLTDGQPTFSAGCRGNGVAQRTADPRPLVDLAREAQAGAIRTFVIGAPGSEQVGVPVFADARSWLSRMALAGGTALSECSVDGPDFCHLDMTEQPDFAEALSGALRQITGQVLTCSYTLPIPPAGMALDLDDVNLYMIGTDGEAELVPRAEDTRCREGWQYTGTNAGIQLCSETCERVQSDPDAQIELLLGCRTRVRIR